MKKQIVFSLLVLLLSVGCVSQSTYELKAKEAAMCSTKSANLESHIKDLAAEFNGMIKDRDDFEKQAKADTKEKEELKAKVAELSTKAEKAEQLEKATQTYLDLQKKLEKEIQDGQVKITEMKNRLTMTMVDKIIFPSGSAKISKEGGKVIDKVVSILKNIKDKRIQVEGHTDNVPIVSSLKKRFPTNWELSTARATEVVRYLHEKGGIDPLLLSATGYAAYQPVAPNDTVANKVKNRRIEIVLLPLAK
jgi:chemotaxis protein MotB